MSDEEPKIIIDEDWKSQVERERQETQDEGKEKTAPEDDKADEAEEEHTLFEQLISGFAAQTMVALGLIVPKDAPEVVVDLDHARYMIDTLVMLKEKTKGNLLPREEGSLTEAVSELQRVFAMRAQQVQEAALQGGGNKPKTPVAGR